jgi:uncharacterized protein YgfB (UPF0149 family)
MRQQLTAGVNSRSYRQPGTLAMASDLSNGKALPLGVGDGSPSDSAANEKLPKKLPSRTDEFFLVMHVSDGDTDLKEAIEAINSWKSLFAGEQPSSEETVADTGIPNIKISYKAKKFSDLEAVSQHLADHEEVAHWDPGKLNGPRLSNELWTVVTKDPPEFKYRVDLSYKLDLKKAKIEFPDWRWENMSGPEIVQLKKFYVALMVHEMGHFFVAAQYLIHLKKTFEGFGPSKTSAKNDAIEQLNETVKEVATDIEQLSNVDYDNATDHGKTQSSGPNSSFVVEGPISIPFPGGRNIAL